MLQSQKKPTLIFSHSGHQKKEVRKWCGWEKVKLGRRNEWVSGIFLGRVGEPAFEAIDCCGALPCLCQSILKIIFKPSLNLISGGFSERCSVAAAGRRPLFFFVAKNTGRGASSPCQSFKSPLSPKSPSSSSSSHHHLYHHYHRHHRRIIIICITSIVTIIIAIIIFLRCSWLR